MKTTTRTTASHVYADLNAIAGIRDITPTQENMDNGSYLENEFRILAELRLQAEMAKDLATTV